MKLLRFFACLGIVLFTGTTFSQEEHSLIKVRWLNDSGEGIPNKAFTLYKGSDSITSATTNKNGEFELELKLEFSTEYRLFELNSEWHNSSPITFETTYYPQTYLLEMTDTEAENVPFQGQIAYYQPNNTKKIEEFEVEQILAIIAKYPNICIEFSQTIIRSESEKTAKKRQTSFLKFLKDNGVDMSCIQFDEETRFLRAFDEDQRSRIQGAIASLEEKCN